MARNFNRSSLAAFNKAVCDLERKASRLPSACAGLWNCGMRERDERAARMRELRDRFERTILAGWPGAQVIGTAAERLPHTSHIAFVGLEQAIVVHGIGPGRRRLLDRLSLRQRVERTLSRADCDGVRSGRDRQRIAVQFGGHDDARTKSTKRLAASSVAATICVGKNRRENRLERLPLGERNRVEFRVCEKCPHFSTFFDWSRPRLVAYGYQRRSRFRLIFSGRQFADGADVVDHITEISLPSRTLATRPEGRGMTSPGVQLPTFVAGPENRLVAATFRRLFGLADCCRASTKSLASYAAAKDFLR